MLALLLLFVLTNRLKAASHARVDFVPQEPPVLINPSMECGDGYYAQTDSSGQTLAIPVGWNWVGISGNPVVNSTQLFFSGDCVGDNLFERIDGIDSLVVRAQDIETPPVPGKPFDVAFYQQTQVVSGTTYSLSAWMLSLCGGSAVPNDCPEGFYMAKMLGMDPTGGTDPLADSVVWMENRNNFVTPDNRRIGWSNLYTAATAETMTMTVFARINSPFQWHGNHAFIDAFSLLQAPTAELVISNTIPVGGSALLPGAVAVAGSDVEIRWQGALSEEVAAIPGGSHELLFDVQVRTDADAPWQNLAVEQPAAGCHLFRSQNLNSYAQFRVRPKAEQLSEGVFPNHRYIGVWSEPQAVFFANSSVEPTVPEGDHLVYLPLVEVEGEVLCGS